MCTLMIETPSLPYLHCITSEHSRKLDELIHTHMQSLHQWQCIPIILELLFRIHLDRMVHVVGRRIGK